MQNIPKTGRKGKKHKVMKLKSTQFIIALSLLLIGIAIVVTTTLPQATKYYVTVDEFLMDTNKYQEQSIKLAGRVVPGSIEKNTQDLTWLFKVMETDKTVNVFYQGAMPDTFKDESDVVLTGSYQGERFIATEVLAKCASRYEEKLEAPLQMQTVSTIEKGLLDE